MVRRENHGDNKTRDTKARRVRGWQESESRQGRLFDNEPNRSRTEEEMKFKRTWDMPFEWMESDLADDMLVLTPIFLGLLCRAFLVAKVFGLI